MRTTALLILSLAALPGASAYAFVAPRGPRTTAVAATPRRSNTALQMADPNVLMGVGIGVAGVAAGVALVAFTEQQGERAKERGAGLSESMSTRIAGGLLEDVEVSSISDVGSLTSQLEKALQEGGAKMEKYEVSEAEMKRMKEEADDGW
jgi:hypothetical protein